MPVRCDVCNSSFKEFNALQMHKAAKRHNQSAAGNASGEKTSRDQAQPKAKPSNTGASPLDKVTSSGGLTFRCSSCDRSCRSREALEAHAKAKAHQLTITASIKRTEKAYFRCDVCSRCDLGSQTALNDHMRDSEGHQNRNQHSAPQEMLSNSQTRTDHGLPLSDEHSLALTVDKMVQCDLCSCKFTENKTCESPLLATSYEGQNQQKMPLSSAKNHHALALGSEDYSGKAASCQSWERCTDSEECVIDAISQQTALAKGKQGDIRLQKIPCKANLGKNSSFLQNHGPRAQPYDISKQADQADDALSSHKFPTIDGRKQNRYLKSAWTPGNDPQKPKYAAVALDCEMVDVVGDGGLWREVVKLSAVDFLSGGTLLDTLVLPTAKVRRWKTEITGITNQTLSEARAQGRTLKGWTEARSELWRYIDADTVLVGQALHHDLDVLGMLHARIVDSAILAAKAIDHPSAKTVGLKKMCKEMLNVDVQCVSSGIHDCLEDVLASRELVLYSIHSPEKVQTWALSKRREELGKAVRLQRQRKDRRSTASSQRMANDLFDDDDEEDDEILRWEDIAEDLGWPHPDTGYDPWSD